MRPSARKGIPQRDQCWVVHKGFGRVFVDGCSTHRTTTPVLLEFVGALSGQECTNAFAAERMPARQQCGRVDVEFLTNGAAQVAFPVRQRFPQWRGDRPHPDLLVVEGLHIAMEGGGGGGGHDVDADAQFRCVAALVSSSRSSLQRSSQGGRLPTGREYPQPLVRGEDYQGLADNKTQQPAAVQQHSPESVPGTLCAAKHGQFCLDGQEKFIEQ